MLPTDKFMSLDSSSKSPTGASRKTRIISATAIFLAVCAFGAAGVAPMAPDASDLPVKSITEELNVPSLSEQIAQLHSDSQSYRREERVRPGDTLATLLSRLGVNDDAAASFIKSDKLAYNVLQLKAGRRVQVETDKDGQLHRLVTTLTDNSGQPTKNIVIARSGEGFTAKESPTTLERRVEMHSGEIRSSLFAATDAAQIPDSVASQIVDMFSTNIDFASDLRKGDRFNVVYETFWQNGEFVRAGRVLAGEFRNGNNRYQSVWFDEPGSKQGGGYYSFDGKSLKKAFLKSPLEFSRVSSGFSMRQHPISGQWRRHEGVDFAAPTGTPIRASGDGVVDFVGMQTGYGNVVVLKHWNNYSTAYAHMSRFAAGLQKGAKVNQGEVIGYVGSTGWSTGPHLHYEFRVNNQPRDPMSIDVPNAQPLAAADLQRFREVASEMSHRFALLNPAENRGKDSGTTLAAK
ncbi:M23 family metallopeptidase [Noviherbaspirillum aerium]|uniref:M23 family metallopeptidase n=1 Tax=Noviherbaspirillum aerium TaxID=2588497 RepID=UPI00124C020A|nr:M23 family metallopeptidase [Noviherbaspirillum aerium]